MLVEGADGHDSIRLTDAGIRLLAQSRQRNQRSLNAHGQLAVRVAARLMPTGRIVWQELSLRARVTAGDSPPDGTAPMTDEALWQLQRK